MICPIVHCILERKIKREYRSTKGDRTKIFIPTNLYLFFRDFRNDKYPESVIAGYRISIYVTSD